ncbi:MAG: hypothetical protein HY267_02220 [Deltaproteobacteria bacterium]|nr:hypothetical protein [Deltaproteobacteria bacterium]
MTRNHYAKSFVVLTLLTGALLMQRANPAQAGSSKISIEPLRVFGVGTVIPGTGTILVRTKEAVGATVHTFGLVPGNAYTLWVTVFNDPKKCSTSPCTVADLPNPDVRAVVLWGSGQIAGDDGTADFGAYREEGDTSGREPAFGTATALEDTHKAEVHLVIRSHGPASADPAVLQQQLSTFNGGCPPNTCKSMQAAPHQP